MRIALTGNPNSGKTTMYNALTGRNEKVGNWAGVTVEKKEYPIKKAYQAGEGQLIAVDLPGAVPVSTLEIVTHQFYPILLLVMTIFAIVSGYGRTLLPDSRAFRESERAVRY